MISSNTPHRADNEVDNEEGLVSGDRVLKRISTSPPTSMRNFNSSSSSSSSLLSPPSSHSLAKHHHHHHHHHHHKRRKRIQDKGFSYEDINKKLSNMRRKSTQRRGTLDKSTERLLKSSLTKFFFMEEGEDGDKERIALVLSQMQRRTINEKEILMTQGEEGGMMYVLVEGTLEIYVNEVYIRDVNRGTVVGELALLYNAPRSATVIAKTRCVLWYLQRETFREVQTVASSASLVQRSIWLRQLPILHSLENEDISKLAAMVKTKNFYPGDIIFTEGALVSTCYLIEMGNVEAQSSIHDSVDELVETLQVEYSQITDTSLPPSLDSKSVSPMILTPVGSDINIPSSITSITPFSSSNNTPTLDSTIESNSSNSSNSLSTLTDNNQMKKIEKEIVKKLSSLSDDEGGKKDDESKLEESSSFSNRARNLARVEMGPGAFLGTPILKSGAGYPGWKWKDSSGIDRSETTTDTKEVTTWDELEEEMSPGLPPPISPYDEMSPTLSFTQPNSAQTTPQTSNSNKSSTNSLRGALSEVTIKAVTKVRCSYFSLNRFEVTFGRIAHALREHDKKAKSSRRDSVHSLRFHDVSINHFDNVGYLGRGSFGIVTLVRKKPAFSRHGSLNSLPSINSASSFEMNQQDEDDGQGSGEEDEEDDVSDTDSEFEFISREGLISFIEELTKNDDDPSDIVNCIKKKLERKPKSANKKHKKRGENPQEEENGEGIVPPPDDAFMIQSPSHLKSSMKNSSPNKGMRIERPSNDDFSHDQDQEEEEEEIEKKPRDDLGEVFALKKMSKYVIMNEEQVNHVRDERDLLENLNHPFIVTLMACFQDTQNLYLLTDAVLGGDLWSLLYEGLGGIEEEKGVPPSHAIFYSSNVVEILSYIHKKGIAYRDLKPENLMVDQNGYLKLVDLGLAKKIPFTIEVDGEYQLIPRSYTMCGTPEYLV